MIVVSGMRPTGKLHIGHYFGALVNWIELQKNDTCYFFVADLHALTTHFETPELLEKNTREMVVDWLACGVDPEKACIFLQSSIPEIPELFLILSMFTPVGWLERSPTFKEQQDQLKDRDLSNLGFLAYPVLQAADVILYKGQRVPVGKDQVPHLELIREITRRCNSLIQKEIFPEPQPLLTRIPKVLGTDGRKMSKSYNNSIFLGDSDQDIDQKIRGMVTDPKRVKRQDPGNPDDCALFTLHEIYSSKSTIEEVRKGCTTAGIGCVDCKKMLLPSLKDQIGVIRERREKFAQSPEKVDEILKKGGLKARQVASQTLLEVKQALHLLKL